MLTGLDTVHKQTKYPSQIFCLQFRMGGLLPCLLMKKLYLNYLFQVSGSAPDTPTSLPPESPFQYNALTMQIYQETIQHLRQDLIREKTSANSRINTLNQELRNLTKK